MIAPFIWGLDFLESMKLIRNEPLAGRNKELNKHEDEIDAM